MCQADIKTHPGRPCDQCAGWLGDLTKTAETLIPQEELRRVAQHRSRCSSWGGVALGLAQARVWEAHLVAKHNFS